MTSNVELAARLLHDAATFFRNVAEQNPALGEQMRDNAKVYDHVAELVERDPFGTIDIDGPERTELH
ncbi:hypothetical protein [Sphingomonas sp.]|uniref:hypothetical protein n=1 Tax=Sphingomonas sp. TaxID=28214 RepID=UPI001B006116|nr:hypothetical protein [Sphingomonas sp.]MBO9711927.1 hypothetical protein [Sphingomonas sp.]